MRMNVQFEKVATTLTCRESSLTLIANVVLAFLVGESNMGVELARSRECLAAFIARVQGLDVAMFVFLVSFDIHSRFADKIAVLAQESVTKLVRNVLYDVLL